MSDQNFTKNFAGYPRDESVLAEIRERADGGIPRPLLLAGGAVVTRDAALGDWAEADVLIGNGLVFGIGPGLRSASDDDGMIVIDCTGCFILPSTTNFTSDHSGHLTPGEKANVAVLRLADPDGTSAIPVVDRPMHLDIVISDGEVVVWGGAALNGAVPTEPRLELIDVADDDPRLALWSDDKNFLRQRLLSGGRYDEGRGDRESAYQGRFWIRGDRIDYLDDMGFWAFGEFKGDVLEHAGYTLRRKG